MTLYADARRTAARAAPSDHDRSRSASSGRYRLLYALHYHGEAAPEAAEGGSIFSQTVAEAGMTHLHGFFSILKRVDRPARPRPHRARRDRRAAGPKARRAATKARAAG
jgi:hypothetical protein